MKARAHAVVTFTFEHDGSPLDRETQEALIEAYLSPGEKTIGLDLRQVKVVTKLTSLMTGEP